MCKNQKVIRLEIWPKEGITSDLDELCIEGEEEDSNYARITLNSLAGEMGEVDRKN